MAGDERSSPTPHDPVCPVCHEVIQPGQDRVTVHEQPYHARCYEIANG